jgi:hypothetical protein
MLDMPDFTSDVAVLPGIFRHMGKGIRLEFITTSPIFGGPDGLEFQAAGVFLNKRHCSRRTC